MQATTSTQATAQHQGERTTEQPGSSQETTTKTCLSCGASVAVREDGTVVGGELDCGH